MSVWILHQSLTPQEEDAFTARKHLALPFHDVPDLTGASEVRQLQEVLRTLNPDLPPETIGRKADRCWALFQGVQLDDLIAVPLVSRGEIALATVTDRYSYAVGPNGEDIHTVDVSWYDTRVPLGKLGKHQAFFKPGGEAMEELTDPEARTALRSHLPHRYNRFARWKWLFIGLLILQALSFIIR